MAFQDTDDGALTIRELTGDRRTVSLAGKHSLPQRPIKLEGTHQVETTWAAGSPTATQQSSGAREATTTLTGWWRDCDLLGADEVVVDGPDFGEVDTAQGLADLIDDIRVKGQDVEVTWNHIARVGVLTRFAQSWHTPSDLEYEMEYAWRSRGRATEARASSTRTATASLTDGAQEVAGRAADVDTATQDMGFYLDGGIDGGLVASLDEIVGDIQDRIFEVQDAVAAMSDGVGGGVDAIVRAASVLSLVENSASLITAEFRGRVDRTIYAASTVQEIAEVAPGKCVAASVTAWGAVRSARDLRFSAARRRVAIQREREATVLALYRAIEADDLRQVATIFYGSPDDWGTIRSYNGLATSKLQPGQVVMVPLPGVTT